MNAKKKTKPTSSKSPVKRQGARLKSPARNKKSKSDVTMATSVVAIVTRHLQSASNEVKAASMSKYMRNQFAFYGVPSPNLTDIFKHKILVESPAITDPAALRSIMISLWNEPHRECMHVALKFAMKYQALLKGENAAECRATMRCVEKMITTNSWWDSIDTISPNLVAYLAKEQPNVVNPILETWITHSNMWLRRAAILYQLKYKGNTDQDKLFRFCLTCCQEKEFFIQKSIGWALRNYFYTAPEAVKDFVKENEDKLAKLSKREALKHAG
ncbi:uncharacterized protein [Asterias amurensis]|uniref:uncharacterized protein n=1 Tax=Asterias amurensis TaxID=7602 RepID=UPI003AB26845